MTCQCGAQFCYDCGYLFENYSQFSIHKFYIGLPLISCPKNFKSKSQEIAVNVATTAGVITLGVPLLALAIPVAAVAVPSYFIVKAIQERKNRGTNS